MDEQMKPYSQEGQTTQVAVEDLVAGLTPEERMLVLLQRELYAGSWEEIQADLQNRLEGRPYIYKLVNRIKDDLDRIEKLTAIEKEYGIKLTDMIDFPLYTASD